MVLAYVLVATLILIVALASTRRPRSVPLMVLAAMLWPLSIAAVAAHAYLATRAPGRQPRAAEVVSQPS